MIYNDGTSELQIRLHIAEMLKDKVEQPNYSELCEKALKFVLDGIELPKFKKTPAEEAADMFTKTFLFANPLQDALKELGKGDLPKPKEEKQKLFDAIKENGYKWNTETKTLENLPKFKVGDRIRKEDNNSMVYTINGVYSSMYGVEERDFGISIEEQDEYELVPNKFDITNLKPYESRVLVRGDIYNFWKPAIFGFIKDKIFYLLGGAAYEQCIPYKNNEHLLGTKNDCDEYYKTWE